MQVWASATEAWGSSLKGVSTVSNTFSPPQAESFQDIITDMVNLDMTVQRSRLRNKNLKLQIDFKEVCWG